MKLGDSPPISHEWLWRCTRYKPVFLETKNLEHELPLILASYVARTDCGAFAVCTSESGV